jgi:hypothetical protein
MVGITNLLSEADDRIARHWGLGGAITFSAAGGTYFVGLGLISQPWLSAALRAAPLQPLQAKQGRAVFGPSLQPRTGIRGTWASASWLSTSLARRRQKNLDSPKFNNLIPR